MVVNRPLERGHFLAQDLLSEELILGFIAGKFARPVLQEGVHFFLAQALHPLFDPLGVHFIAQAAVEHPDQPLRGPVEAVAQTVGRGKAVINFLELVLGSKQAVTKFQRPELQVPIGPEPLGVAAGRLKEGQTGQQLVGPRLDHIAFLFKAFTQVRHLQARHPPVEVLEVGHLHHVVFP